MSGYKFSVSMCVYAGDKPAWFRAAVNSVLEQSLKPDEVILVVDGPVPKDLQTLIEGYEKLPFFKVFPLAENQGHGNARRFGLSHCSNELVALMDADDLSLPNRFQLQIERFKGDDSLDIVGGNIAEFIGEGDNVVAERIVPLDDGAIKAYMKKRCPMNQVTVMFKRSRVDLAGGYIDWYCDEDYYLWIRMAQAGMRFANIPETLCRVRVGEDMYRRRGGMKLFRSEKRLQRYMLRSGMIGPGRYILNMSQRFIVQVLLPVKIRGWVFKKFARKGAMASENKV